MFCYNCGRPMRKNARFCVYCGKPALILIPQQPVPETSSVPSTGTSDPPSAPKRTPGPEAAPEPELEPVLKPEPEPEAEPAPKAESKPAPESEPAPAPKAVPESELEPVSKPEPVSAHAPKPRPIYVAPVELDPAAPVLPTAKPALSRKPAPLPVPEPAPQAEPEPAPEPVPASKAESKPVPAPKAEPEPAPEPAPADDAASRRPENPSQPAATPRKNLFMPLMIGLCVLILALLAAIVLLLLPRSKSGLKGAAAPEATSAAQGTPEASAVVIAETAAPTDRPDPAVTASPAKVRKALPDTEGMPALKEGEIVFWGAVPCEGSDEVAMRFILSADRKTIHHLKLSAANIKIQSGKSSVTLSRSSVSSDSARDVTFPGTTDEIVLGECRIRELTFEDEESAHARLTFVFRQPGVGGSVGSEVTLPEVTLLLEAVDPGTSDRIAEAPDPAASPASGPTNTPPPSATPQAAPGTADSPEPSGTPVPATIFSRAYLKNWTDEAIREAYGVKNLAAFKPRDPQPMFYFVSVKPVIDPVTGKESAGGYDRNYARHNPIDTQTLMEVSGNLTDGGLTLTDDPDRATFVLILSFNYKASVTSFTFRDGSKVKQYNPLLTATLKNLVTGKQITSTKKTYATYANERVYTSMLNAAKGKQLYGGAPSLSAGDFKDDYWAFVTGR